MSREKWREKLEQAKRNWEEKLAHYEYELSITSNAENKFELRKKIQECEEEIKRINAKPELIGKDNEPKTSSFSDSQTVVSSSKTESSSLHLTKPNNNSKILMKDVFICHASEDKLKVVEPLVDALKQANISYWYDKAEIKWGDSITKKVNEGLSISRFVIVVLSKAFLNKKFPRHELDSILNIEIYSNEVKILPLVATSNQKEKEEILTSLPLLNNKAYETWDSKPQKIIDALLTRLLKEKLGKSDEIPKL